MSVMSNLSLEIETMLEQDFSPATIAIILEIPVSWVYETIESFDDFIEVAV